MRLFTWGARKRERRDEMLSAYVDGQLSAGERVRLEAQLAADSALQAELEALRHTVALVRDLPPVPLPRNFILPQEMKTSVAARPRPARRVRPRRAWAAPLLTAATVVVSLFFVVVLAGDLLLSGIGGQAFAPAAAPHKEAPQVAMESAPVSEEIEVEAEAEGEIEVEVEKAIPAATSIPIPAEVPPRAATTATPGAEHYGVETPEDVEATALAAEGGGPVEEDNALAPSPGPAAMEEAAAAPTAPAAATVVMKKSVGEAEPTPSEVAQVAPPVAGEEERGVSEGEDVEPASVSLWRVLQVALGLTALALALVTVWAWRVRRQ
ncbi:MAG: hypothetical protein DRI77_13755 [Chloroflexi bacterium]|nr:MAG: hypothetical protein DRI77_13755 [Chloroflexota bacterium]